MELSRADRIWNRATEDNNPHAAAGDQALTDMLQVHGLVMNGGVLNAVEITEEAKLARAVAGYEFFGLNAVKVLLLEAKALVEHHAFVDSDERRLDSQYARIIPDDSHLVAVFARHLRDAPGDFAPL